MWVYRRGPPPPKGFTNAFLLENEDSGTNAAMFLLLSFLCLSAEAVCVCVCHCAHVKGELWDCCLHGCYWEACCCVMEMRQLLFTSAPVSASAVSLFFLNQQCRHLLCICVLSIPWLWPPFPHSTSRCKCVLRWGLLYLLARHYCRIFVMLISCYTDQSDGLSLCVAIHIERILYFISLCLNIGAVILFLVSWCANKLSNHVVEGKI